MFVFPDNRDLTVYKLYLFTDDEDDLGEDSPKRVNSSKVLKGKDVSPGKVKKGPLKEQSSIRSNRPEIRRKRLSSDDISKYTLCVQ